jgi:glycosyltransferase involved in cell wall biosynthesis
MVRLSFIIPVYNSEPYIDRCLESIYAQNVSEKEFEIICVDDCSKDNSIKLIERFYEEHSNLYIISHDKNQQQGAARNTGMKEARGDYIWFVDADDYIENETFATLLHCIEKSCPDILQFNAYTESPDGTKRHDVFWEDKLEGFSGLDYWTYEMEHNYTNRIKAVWSKLYKREFLISNGLFFQEGIYWEDVVHTLKAFFHAHSFKYIPVIAYNYCETPNSDMRGQWGGRKVADSIRFCADSITFISGIDVDKKLSRFLIQKYVSTITKYKNNLHSLSFMELIVFLKRLRDIELDILLKYLDNSECKWLINKPECLRVWFKNK